MIKNTVKISDGWKLGWKTDYLLGSWTAPFNFWRVEDGWLKGWKKSGFALIHSNVRCEEDYIFECDMKFEVGGGTAGLAINYQVNRRSYYYLEAHVGGQLNATYIFSDAHDKKVMSECGPVIELGRVYHISVQCCGKDFSVFVDGERIGGFAEEDYMVTGRFIGFFSANNCLPCFGNVIFKKASGEILFEDDFSKDSLNADIEVDYADLECDNWIDADLPGTAHSSLLKAGLIDDPYIADNGHKLLWIDRQRWIYRKKFTLPIGWKDNYKKLTLEFEGVDYTALFYLNGKSLCFHEGMFGGPEIDITDTVIADGENEITVCVLPCPKGGHDKAKPHILQRWHFNMDIIPVGIWRDVKLVAYDNIYASAPRLVTEAIEGDSASMSLELDLNNITDESIAADIKVDLEQIDGGHRAEFDFKAEFAPGVNTARYEFTVDGARLWWPNGLGEQNRYKATVTVKGEDGSTHSLSFNTGIRTLKFLPSPNKAATENWIPCINGRQFFGKGSNWVPVDQMLRLDIDRYDKMLRRVRDANINILRPWGGGLIETDEFYDLCDKYGICVWQELLMACGYYTMVDPLVWADTMKRSAIRLRNRPSLIAWCGGNECDPDCDENVGPVDLMEATINEFDPAREFRRNSPYGGDSHSYKVNFIGRMNYTYFTRDISAAITEFSMGSPSCMNMLEKVLTPEEMAKFPPDVPDAIEERFDYFNWADGAQRRESSYSLHNSGNITNLMLAPMSDCGMPKSWSEYVRYMQTAHGILTQFGQDFFRSRWPYCTMSMSWVVNQLATGTIDWAYVDWDGMPKISYYFKKRSFEPLHVGAVFEEMATEQGETFKAKIFAVNELLSDKKTQVKIRLYDSALRLLSEAEFKKVIPADTVRTYGFYKYEVPSDAPDGVLFLCVDMLCADTGALLSRSLYSPRIGERVGLTPYYPSGPWICDVEKAKTQLEFEYAATGELNRDGERTAVLTVRNIGALPAYQVGFDTDIAPEAVSYSDNYFWLEAGESVSITVSAEVLPEKLISGAWNSERTTIYLK